MPYPVSIRGTCREQLICNTHTSWNSSSVFCGVKTFNRPIICQKKKLSYCSASPNGWNKWLHVWTSRATVLQGHSAAKIKNPTQQRSIVVIHKIAVFRITCQSNPVGKFLWSLVTQQSRATTLKTCAFFCAECLTLDKTTVDIQSLQCSLNQHDQTLGLKQCSNWLADYRLLFPLGIHCSCMLSHYQVYSRDLYL